MSVIDIRKEKDDVVTRIEFSDMFACNTILGSPGGQDIVIAGETEAVLVSMRDIDNLIKALEKAKELWA